jgi:hypothetical protein
MLAKDGERVIVQVDPEVEETWGNLSSKTADWFAAAKTCTPSYFNAEGEGLTRPVQSKEATLRLARISGWSAGPVDWQERLEASAAKPNLEGFNVTVLA